MCLAQYLTLSLLREEGEQRLEFKFMYEELPEFQEDESEKSTRIVEQWERKLITREEARKALGYPDEPEGETWYEPAANLLPQDPGEEEEEDPKPVPPGLAEEDEEEEEDED